MGRWRASTPAGRWAPIRPRRRQLTAKAAHLQTRSDGQCRERALAEGPDAGGEPEQRRRVERDAQARAFCASGRAGAAQVVIAPSMERIAPVT